jgi:adenosylmethionine-8-amino-7-oxononanoate aminotransferase
MESDGPVTLVRGKGVYVWDADGRRYLDGLASLWNVSVGHGRAEIARAVAAQMRALSFAPTLLGFSSEPAQQLAARIARMAPAGLDRVVFTCGGSEANETLIRLVRLYWRLRGRADKIGIVALNNAYHGSSTGAASLTGLATFHRYYEPLMDGVARMVRPFCYRCELGLEYPACRLACADELERLVEREGAERIGAFIAEPVQGVGGVIVPPPEYFARIRSICDRHEILFAVDEVITGFGRLGHPFGIQRFGVVPDLIVFAKGVTSGYLPLGGVIVRDSVYQSLLDAGPDFALHHGYTYSGHPVVCAAALANLDILERERLIERARDLAPYLTQRLEELRHHSIVGDVRSAGLMGADEFVRDRESKAPFPPEARVAFRVRDAALARGVIVRASGDVVAVCPPLIIKEEQIDQLVAVLDASIAEVVATFSR